MLPRLPPFTATRSTVLGVDRTCLSQPLSSGPAVPLSLNHTSCIVSHTCEYCAGVLPVSDMSVLAPQPASRPPAAARSATCRRWFMPVPVQWLPGMMLRSSLPSQRGCEQELFRIVDPWRASHLG